MSDEEKISLREYGQLEMRVELLQTQVSSMDEDIKAMRALMEQGKGSWRTLVLIGGMATTIGGASAWLVSHLPKMFQ